jgi:hypothetical protein
MPTLSLRPALAILAADPSSTTVRKLWKALSADERTSAISAAMTDDPEGWVKNATRAAVAKALRFRPQTVSIWPKPKLVAEAARLPIDDVQLLSAYVVDLHLGYRRPMMGAFLDQLGITNDDGRIDSEKIEVPEQDAARVAAAADAIVATYPPDEVTTYFLTLLLQAAAVWGGLVTWLESRAATAGAGSE